MFGFLSRCAQEKTVADSEIFLNERKVQDMHRVSKESASTACSDSDDSREDRLSLADIQSAVETWIRTASKRDVNAMVQLYDPELGRLLGTVDNAEDVHRSTPSAIREYFVHFLGGHEAVVPSFPTFNAKDVIFLSKDTAIYNGYYTFALTKNDAAKT